MEPELVFEDDIQEMTPKDRRDIKRNISVVRGEDAVYVYAIAVSRDIYNDDYISVPATLGDPIGDMCYNIVQDRFYVKGVSYHMIGEIPVSYRLEIDNHWQVNVPLPPSVIKRYMTELQRSDFLEWKQSYKNCDIEFMQLLSVF